MRVSAMTAITINLSDEHLQRLRALAARLGLSPEDFLRTQVEQFLAGPDEEFARVAQYLLRKNAELYRRLA
jgi:antitoxin FitA